MSVGTPGRTLPMSAISIASDRNSSGCVCGYALRALPTSSWPSITSLIPDRRRSLPRPQGADVGDHVRLGVRRAATEQRAVALVGSNAGESHLVSSPRGTTS